ncbi:MAG: PspC domain-containing protein [Acidimicrobiia bacterium]|nr:PspC domain-containing protein [Acidimicrobiia bacterium]
MTAPAPTRRLYRSRGDRMLGGVAAGLADYLQVDSALVRLAFVALVLAAGTGILLYVIAWIVIPEEPLAAGRPSEPSAADPGAAGPAEAATAVPAVAPRSGSAAGRGARLVVGTILVAIGCLLLLDWALPGLRHFFWPAAIITLGLGLLLYGARR